MLQKVVLAMMAVRPVAVGSWVSLSVLVPTARLAVLALFARVTAPDVADDPVPPDQHGENFRVRAGRRPQVRVATVWYSSGAGGHDVAFAPKRGHWGRGALPPIAGSVAPLPEGAVVSAASPGSGSAR